MAFLFAALLRSLLPLAVPILAASLHVPSRQCCVAPCLLQLEAGSGSSTKLGMPCTTCLHPTCKHSPAQQGVLACPECR